jgi:pilus assembly protein CpaB
MSFRTVFVVMLSLLCGGSSIILLRQFAGQSAAASAPQTTPVLVAAADVARGTVLTTDHLKVRNFPSDLVPAGAMSDPEKAQNHVTWEKLSKDEVVLESKLTANTAGRGLATLIPKGMRAFTILTPSLAANVSGFIVPGNRVDVLLTLNGDDAHGGGSTTTLLQNVEIWAVGQKVDVPAENRMDAGQFQAVTFLLTPDQAAKLDLGQGAGGTLHLALRNPEDDQPARTRPATLNDIRFHQEKPWEERLKGVAEAMAKVMAQFPRKPEVVKIAAPPPPPPVVQKAPEVQVRTLRGTAEGLVRIETALPQP